MAAEEITEIIVTVRQRAESIQDVPGSVTAFSAAQIEATGIQRAEDFISQTPGVSLVPTPPKSATPRSTSAASTARGTPRPTTR